MPNYNLQIIRSARRSFCLQLADSAQVIARVPWQATLAEIDDFIAKHHAWIDKQLARQQPHQPHEFKTNEIFWFLGEEKKLIISQKNNLPLTVDQNFILAPDYQEFARPIITKWYKQQANLIFNDKLQQFQTDLNIKCQSFRLSEANTRWGSCNQKKHIALNWRLIMAPPTIIDYVIIHELTHILHFNHSALFWQHVAEYIPDFKYRRQWLRTNAYKLAW